MHLRVSLLAVALASFAGAQSPFVVAPINAGPYAWVPPQGDNAVFFDLVVNTTVTIQGLTHRVFAHVSDPITTEVYLTNSPITTYQGNIQNAAAWTLAGTSDVSVSTGLDTRTTCFPGGIVIQPGTYGVCFRGIGGCLGFWQNTANPAVPQVFSNADFTLTGGDTQYAPFVSPGQNPATFFCWGGSVFYVTGVASTACASTSTGPATGIGCNLTSASFYQHWMSVSAASLALTGKSLSMVATGTGYNVVSPGVSAYLAPSLTATLIHTGVGANNTEVAVTLPVAQPFPLPNAVTTPTLNCHANGYVSVGPNATFPLQTYNYMPDPRGLLNSTNAIYAGMWKDFYPGELNSGRIKHEQVGNLYCFTWDGVESFPGSTTSNTPNPCTFQIQFDLVTGDVHYIYVNVTAVGGGLYYDAVLIGYSPGGPSVDRVPVDINGPFALALTQPEISGLTLKIDVPPVLGGQIVLTTSNNSPVSLGLNYISWVTYTPPFDLGFLGAPNCGLGVDINVGFSALISDLLVMTHTAVVPNDPALNGFQARSQSLWLDPLANAAGLTTSNSVDMTVGTFGQ